MEKVIIYQKVSNFREKVLTKLVGLLNPIYKALMPRNRAWKLTKADLNRFPKGSLGRDLSNFLDENKFDLLPYLETHDVYHVLLGYKPTIIDESRMYFFLLGNGKYSFEVINTVLISLVLLPEYWSDLFSHFHRGKACKNISKWDFRYLMHEETSVLRGILNNNVEAKFFV